MIRHDRTSERLIALFILGAALILPPMLLVFNRPIRVLGVPVLYLYLLLAWAGIIALCMAAARRIEPVEGTDPTPGAETRAQAGPADA